ncbi:MAG: polyprenyl synthetase family protein [Bacteroidota bacterium]|nr:polyprenyl synthetase family protein [Bacteroidota bacterium]MDP4212222.1 polyprenyl synthetase family protein [Bacteroidota bacterium]MDP4251750.1 polyprenyl synthetase family protein [Bacteroidota bacterium]
MKRFQELSHAFLKYFDTAHFPDQPSGLYDAASYMLGAGGKRIRPVLCLMGNELFANIHADAWKTATAIELFHNFTLIHDDIMDKAPLRRGNATVHAKFNESSALLAGDVMLLRAYGYLNTTESHHVQMLISQMNEVGRQVCEGQQMDMDFENRESVPLISYLQMIELKTAVLLAASLRMGAFIAGAGEDDQRNLYAFGKNLGLAFQVQDDWLDAFGDPEKFGKKTGGDIIQNKKTFLLLKALETADASQKKDILQLLEYTGADKVDKMLVLFSACGVDKAAQTAQKRYFDQALADLEQIRIPPERKIPLKEMAAYLLQRNA